MSGASVRCGQGALVLLLLITLTTCRPAGSPQAPAVASPDAWRWPTFVLQSATAVTVDRPSGGSFPLGSNARGPLGADWLEFGMERVSERTKDPPGASRAYALVAVASFDAFVAASYWGREHGQPGYPSKPAAVAGAASRVLAHLFPEYSALRLDRMAEEEAGGEAGKAGLKLGREVAEQVIAHARTDGADRVWDGARPPFEPRYWSPPPGSVSPPVQPLAGTWKTWVIESGKAIRPPPPPEYGSPQCLTEARELIELRRSLTPKQQRAAKFWEGGQGTPLPAGIWNRIVIDHLEANPSGPAQEVKTLALLNVALADAGIAAWDAKYTYWTPRPENAIPDLLDPAWKPYLQTPLFPAYVSGHSTYSAAAAVVLAELFPADGERFRAMGEEAGLSRLYGGIHWRSDHVEGSRLGREIGRQVAERAKLLD